MRLTFPLNYQAYFKKPKEGSWKNETLITDYSCTLKTIPEDDAPAVFNVGEAPYGEKGYEDKDRAKAFRPPLNKTTATIRRFGEDFYIERFAAADAQVLFSTPPAGDDHHVRSQSPFFGFYDFAVDEETEFGRTKRFGYHENTPLRTRSDVMDKLNLADVKRWTTYEDEYRRAADEIMSNYAVIGDMVYEKVAEPVLKLIDNGKAFVLVIDELTPKVKRLLDAPVRGEFDSCLAFGIDEFENVVQLGSQFAKSDRKPFLNFATVTSVTPWEVTFRGENQSLYRNARQAYRRLCLPLESGGYKKASLMSLLTREPSLALYDLALAIEGHAETTPKLLHAVRHFVAIVENADAVEDLFDVNGFELEYGRSFAKKSEASRRVIAEAMADRIEALKEEVLSLSRSLQVYDRKADNKLDWTNLMLDAEPTFSGDCRYFEVTNLHTAITLSERLGVDLTGAAEDAALGRGRLIAIENFVENSIVAAAYVSETPDPEGPIVYRQSGARASRTLLQPVIDMIAAAKPNTVAVADELAEYGF